MAILKRKNETPPGGWSYFQKETEFTIKGENRSQLIERVVAHREYRNLHPQVPALVALDIERQICGKLGHNECRPEDASDKWQARDGSKQPVTMSSVLAFSKAAIAFIASGGELAQMEEVERRATICRGCFLNQKMSGCACNVFYKAIDAVLPKARKLDGLHVCGVCHCSNAVKVNLTEAQVLASNDGRELLWPETPCWQAEIEAKHAAANLPSA